MRIFENLVELSLISYPQKTKAKMSSIVDSLTSATLDKDNYVELLRKLVKETPVSVYLFS